MEGDRVTVELHRDLAVLALLDLSAEFLEHAFDLLEGDIAADRVGKKRM